MCVGRRAHLHICTWHLKESNRGPPGGVYDDSTFYMMEKEERADGSHLYRFVGGQKSGRMAKSKRRVHFVGIGGAGLSSLASLALKKVSTRSCI